MHVVNLKIGPQQHQKESQSKTDNSENLISILFMYIMYKERERVVKKPSRRQAIEWMTPFFLCEYFNPFEQKYAAVSKLYKIKYINLSGILLSAFQ